MDKMFFCCVMAIAACVLVSAYDFHQECSASHGITVRGLIWLECLHGEKPQ